MTCVLTSPLRFNVTFESEFRKIQVSFIWGRARYELLLYITNEAVGLVGLN